MKQELITTIQYSNHIQNNDFYWMMICPPNLLDIDAKAPKHNNIKLSKKLECLTQKLFKPRQRKSNNDGARLEKIAAKRTGLLGRGCKSTHGRQSRE